jgi:hypothetical protein
MPKSTPTLPLLSPKEFSRVFSSDQLLAEYLASLSPEQIRTYQAMLRKDKNMSPPAQKTLLKLFTSLEKEAEGNYKEVEKTLLPLASGIATAMALLEQIEALEDLQRSL